MVRLPFLQYLHIPAAQVLQFSDHLLVMGRLDMVNVDRHTGADLRLGEVGVQLRRHKMPLASAMPSRLLGNDVSTIMADRFFASAASFQSFWFGPVSAL